MRSSLRLFQIRLFAKMLEFCGRTSFGRSAIVRLRRHHVASACLNFLLGYRRTFSSFPEAEKYATRFAYLGHEHPDNIAHHQWQATRLRESDYPVLFYLAPMAPGLRYVFDLGGNIGNLFYSLRQQLTFPNDLLWQVYDLPLMRSKGAELAFAKNERRIRFTDDFGAAAGCDLFIASGCLHYFERPLAEMLASLKELPREVMINRMPCLRDTVSQGRDLITVQDNRSYVVPVKVQSAKALVESLGSLGYTLRASWRVHELHLWVPLYPELSSEYYSGFYFHRNDTRPGVSAAASN